MPLCSTSCSPRSFQRSSPWQTQGPRLPRSGSIPFHSAPTQLLLRATNTSDYSSFVTLEVQDWIEERSLPALNRRTDAAMNRGERLQTRFSLQGLGKRRRKRVKTQPVWYRKLRVSPQHYTSKHSLLFIFTLSSSYSQRQARHMAIFLPGGAKQTVPLQWLGQDQW